MVFYIEEETIFEDSALNGIKLFYKWSTRPLKIIPLTKLGEKRKTEKTCIWLWMGLLYKATLTNYVLNKVWYGLQKQLDFLCFVPIVFALLHNLYHLKIISIQSLWNKYK